MDVAGLVDQLRDAGVPDDDDEIPGRSTPQPREGAGAADVWTLVRDGVLAPVQLSG